MQISTKKILNICTIICIFILTMSTPAIASEIEEGWSLYLATSNNRATLDNSTDLLLLNGIPYVYTRTVANFFNMILGWTGSTREVSFAYNNNIFKAIVDSPECTINDEVVNLINPVIMSSGRSYISTIDLSLLGLDVAIDSKKQTVTVETPRAKLNEISWTKEGGCDVVTVTFDCDVTYTKSVLSIPDRLLIDVPDAKFEQTLVIPARESHIINNIRVGDNGQRTVRIVLDLSLSASASVTHEGNVIKIKFNNPITEANISESGEIEYVTLLSEEFINCPAVIKTGDNIYYYDLADVTLIGGNREFTSEREDSGIEWVKIAQFDVNTVRLAIKIKSDFTLKYMNSENVKEFTIAINSNIKPEISDPQKVLEAILEANLQEQLKTPIYHSAVVVIKYEAPTEFNLFRLTSPNRIVVDLTSVNVAKVSTEMTGKEGVVTSIRTSQFTKEDARVVLDVDASCSVEYVINEEKTEMIITLNTSNIAGKVVMIDPGHGGIDGGASYEDAIEKKINMAVAEKLRDLLIGAGATVIMTRDIDMNMSLAERSSMANLLMPDIFLSIHSNSAWNVTAEGAESYYLNLEFFSKPLAQYLLNEMVKVTGQKSRGAKSENFHVVRETYMPSTLVELGFITNTDERNNLLNPEFQDKLALGLFNGLEAYFASDIYSNWVKLKSLLIDTKLVGDPKAVSDILTTIEELLKEYKINPDVIKYLTPAVEKQVSVAN